MIGQELARAKAKRERWLGSPFRFMLLADTPLRREMNGYALGLKFSACQRLMALGVPTSTIAELTRNAAIGTARVCLQARGEFWEPEGPDARLLLAVPDEMGLLGDIVAVSTSCPTEWAMRTGMGTMLGRDAMEEAERRAFVHGHARLRLHAAPIDWLIAGCTGVCPLDWKAALPELRGLGEQVELQTDAGTGERLRALLSYGNLPRIRETAPVRRAA